MDESTIHGIFWNHLVYPELASDEVEDPALVLAWVNDRLPDGRWPDYVVCLAVDRLDDEPSGRRRSAVRGIRAMLIDTLPPSGCALLGFAHTNALYFCGRLAQPMQGFLEGLQKVVDRVQGELGLVATAGVACLPEATLAGLQSAAQFAIVAQRRKVRSGPGRVYVCDPASAPAPSSLGAYWALAQRMNRVVRAGDPDAASAEIDSVTRALFEDAYLALSHLRPVLQCHVIFMAQAVTDLVIDPEAVARRTEEYLQQIGTAFDYDILRGLLADAARTFSGMVRDRFVSMSERLVSAVDQCVADSYTDPGLGLPQIAARLGASPTHISRTYKRVKGIGLTRSINEIRVARAMRGLADEAQSVTTVAFDCGFGSLQNFDRVFKQITGATPTAYRRAKMAQPGA